MYMCETCHSRDCECLVEHMFIRRAINLNSRDSTRQIKLCKTQHIQLNNITRSEHDPTGTRAKQELQRIGNLIARSNDSFERSSPIGRNLAFRPLLLWDNGTSQAILFRGMSIEFFTSRRPEEH
ncbi:hypothetical protein T265_01145 [Opisthorchis viverrini]|uniref:Uncharacterized protein n=1 Tax=Opisthorchis viverrini TaxID=6198 RepID=A0A075A3L0_OPIVI|nr:hypothetical protein T265_01145 [Opisthorchis viverrini]KER32857.1 hypothetical protein T265_01145 [Opisthorchis viverrini]